LSVTTKLFMSGRSQAIRLPAKLRLNAKEVRIEQVGNALWVSPEPTTGPQGMAQWLQDFYQNTPVLPETFLGERQDLAPQPRDWS
jgi:antitoxin VapB